MAHIADLSTLALEDAAPFGGKARGLARLRVAGARVPPGFAVAAGVWDEAVQAAFVERCAALLRQGRVAVRSSALAEDGAQHSFAGLFVSTLDVSTVEEALAAAEATLASGASERVLAYAGQALPVGLVVQAMVPASAAGVLFTVDPEGQDPALVLEVVSGLGEALVSGHAEPERWRVYRTGLGEIEARRVGGPLVLAEARVRALAEEAWSLAERLGEPLDMEWAIDAHGTLSWLQARPITVRAPFQPPHITRAVPHADDGPVSVWANFNVRETMPEPFSPLSWSVWKEGLVPCLVAEFFGVPESSPMFSHVQALDLVQGRVYWNMNAVLAIPFLGTVLMAGLSIVDATSAVALRALKAKQVLTPRRIPGNRLVLMPKILWTTLRFNILLLRWVNPERDLAHIRRAGARMMSRPPLSGYSDEELKRELTLFSWPENQDVRDGMQMLTAVLPVLGAAHFAFAGFPDAQEALTWGVRDNPTTLISVSIERLARTGAAFIGQDEEPREHLRALRRRAPAEPELAAWLADFDAFLVENGQRCPREFDIAVPRWADQPEVVLEHIRAAARSGGEGAAARLERVSAERERLIGAALAAAPFWRRPMMRWLAGLLPRFMPLREAPKHEALRCFYRVRLAGLELGRRLVERGQLSSPDDVFNLHFEDLERGGDLRGLAAERAAALERFAASPAPDIVRSDGVPVEEQTVAEDEPGTFSGMGIGRGVGEGVVVIPERPDPRLIPPGSVLVVKLADPAWTPLFPHVAAIMMEVGGTMCHAAVVARELGVPMLVGVRGVTSRVQPGQRVRLDAAAGRAVLLPD